MGKGRDPVSRTFFYAIHASHILNELSRIRNLESKNFGCYLKLCQKAKSQETMDIVNLFGHVRDILPLFDAI